EVGSGGGRRARGGGGSGSLLAAGAAAERGEKGIVREVATAEQNCRAPKGGQYEFSVHVDSNPGCIYANRRGLSIASPPPRRLSSPAIPLKSYRPGRVASSYISTAPLAAPVKCAAARLAF